MTMEQRRQWVFGWH
jgi:hypothetical protein